MMNPDGMMGWGGWGLWAPMGFVMLLFWGLVIVVLILAVRWLWAYGGPRVSTPGTDGPVEILKRRYARGEISKEEFDRMKQDLT